jgi:hypothetical protein
LKFLLCVKVASTFRTTSETMLGSPSFLRSRRMCPSNGLLAPELAAGIQRVKSAKSIGVRMGMRLALERLKIPRCASVIGGPYADDVKTRILNTLYFEPFREAGLLAIELAKETQGRIAEGMHWGDKDRVIYEAVLSAANEYPEEVTQIALELSARRDVPRQAIERGIAARKREAKMREEWRKSHPEEERANRLLPPPQFQLRPRR